MTQHLSLPNMNLLLTVLLLPIISIHGHGYLKTPRSRNLHAYLERDWEDGGGNSPYPEDCTFLLSFGYCVSWKPKGPYSSTLNLHVKTNRYNLSLSLIYFNIQYNRTNPKLQVRTASTAADPVPNAASSRASTSTKTPGYETTTPPSTTEDGVSPPPYSRPTSRVRSSPWKSW